MNTRPLKGWSGFVNRLRRDERGVAMVSVGLLGAFLVMISVVVAIRTLNTSSSVDQDRSYEQAIHVAESGADQALYALDTGADLAEVDLSAAPTKAEVVSAAEKVATDDPGQVVTTPEGEVVVIKDDVTNVAFAVGFSPGIDAANRSARVIVVEYSFDPGVPITFPDGAVVADGDVTMVGNADTVSDPPAAHSADIHTNGDYTGTGNSDVDGDISASGSVTGGNAYGTKTSGADPVPFPTQEEVDAWQATLKAEAMTGPTLATLSGAVLAPAYVPGSFTANCKCTIVLNGPGVIYVDGDFSISSKVNIVNNGATLAVAGTFSMSGQSTYSVTGDPATTGLVVFGTGSQALQITGQGSTASQGFVYVPNGGAKISGNGAFVGSVVAGGDVSISGNGGIIYPDGLNGMTTITPPTDGSPVVDGINEIGVGEL